MLKDYFFYRGQSDITGSRDATREAFQKGLIEDGEAWMEMIKSRNRTADAYKQKIAEEIALQIVTVYCECFERFSNKMKVIKQCDLLAHIERVGCAF